MRVIKTFIVILFVSAVFFRAGAAEPNNLSAYYGFEEIEIIKLDWGIKALRIADFNGDDRNDIAVANNRKARIELLIQKEGIEPAEIPVAVTPEDIDINAINPPSRFDRQNVAVSQKIYSLVTGDLNSDGLTDLAFYGDPKGLYVILQKPNGTEDKKNKLSWRTRKKINIDDGLLTPYSLICADLNNDGRDDIALAGRDVIYMILQKEDGSLAEAVKYPTTAIPRGIETTDLNGDNINDLIIVANDIEKPIHARFGLGTGQLGPQIRLFIENPWSLEFCNIDETVGDELLTVDSKSGRLLCYKLVAENQQDLNWPILFYPLASGEKKTARDLVTGDFDGDGLTDVIISEPASAELVLYKQLPGTGLTEPVRFPAFADITNLSVDDIDADGKSEVAALSVKEKIIGLSRFENDRLSFPKPLEITGEPLAMELADIDNDGDTDCVYVSKDANDLRALRVIYSVNLSAAAKADSLENNALDILKEPSGDAHYLELAKLTSDPDGLKVLDADQDGLNDILIFDKYNPPPMFVRQSAQRKFELIDSPKAQASLIKDAALSSIALADVDEKAGKELLLAQKNFARSLVFSDARNWTVIDQYNAKSTENRLSAVAAFNIEGIGSAEQLAILLLDGQKGQLQILKPDDDKTYRFEKELDVGKWNAANHLKILYAPLTGTDAKSILLFDSEKFALITPPANGSFPLHLEPQFSYETKIKDGVYGHLAVGDINGDDRADIVMVEYRRNHIEILALDSQYKPTPAMRFKIFEQKNYRDKKRSKSSVEPRELKIADVTADGKADLVTLIHDRIIIYPQD